MAYLSYVLILTVTVLLGFVEVAMLLRAVLSLFAVDEETGFGTLLYYVTEPFILPIRTLCDRNGWFQDLPLDIPFLITNLILSMLFFWLV